MNVKHKHSLAYHPQSNSLAERAVGSLKNSLKKSPERMSKLFLKEIVFEINSTVSQEMTGSANDRFLNRSIRSLLPNSIDPNLNPKELIRKRILNHEHRIKNKNKNNKVIYDIGARVRLQEVKTKEFSILGTVTEQRFTDSGVIVSYLIKTDLGYYTTRHRRFMKELAKEHDPKEKTANNDTNLNDTAADRDILGDIVKAAPGRSESGGDSEEIVQVVPRRSGRIKRSRASIGVIRTKVNKVSTAFDNSLEMGQSCSTQLAAEKEKNKQLESRVKLYEAGITDSSLHASQTNIGLLTVATEDISSGCNCSSQSLWGVLEIIAVMLACVLFLYIGYTCLVSYCTRKKLAKEKQHRKLIEQMETKLGKSQSVTRMKPNLAIEMSPSAPECGRVHIPDYQVQNQNSQSTQHNQTFE